MWLDQFTLHHLFFLRISPDSATKFALSKMQVSTASSGM